jgi:hypothetical protein
LRRYDETLNDDNRVWAAWHTPSGQELNMRAAEEWGFKRAWIANGSLVIANAMACAEIPRLHFHLLNSSHIALLDIKCLEHDIGKGAKAS